MITGLLFPLSVIWLWSCCFHIVPLILICGQSVNTNVLSVNYPRLLTLTPCVYSTPVGGRTVWWTFSLLTLLLIVHSNEIITSLSNGCRLISNNITSFLSVPCNTTFIDNSLHHPYTIFNFFFHSTQTQMRFPNIILNNFEKKSIFAFQLLKLKMTRYSVNKDLGN